MLVMTGGTPVQHIPESRSIGKRGRVHDCPAKLTARSHIDRVRKLALALAREEGNAVLPGAIGL